MDMEPGRMAGRPQRRASHRTGPADADSRRRREHGGPTIAIAWPCHGEAASPGDSVAGPGRWNRRWGRAAIMRAVLRSRRANTAVPASTVITATAVIRNGHESRMECRPAATTTSRPERGDRRPVRRTTLWATSHAAGFHIHPELVLFASTVATMAGWIPLLPSGLAGRGSDSRRSASLRRPDRRGLARDRRLPRHRHTDASDARHGPPSRCGERAAHCTRSGTHRRSARTINNREQDPPETPHIETTVTLAPDCADAAIRVALAEQASVSSPRSTSRQCSRQRSALTPLLQILDACNPGFAQRALQIDPNVSLLLPCNVTVERSNAAPGSPLSIPWS